MGLSASPFSFQDQLAFYGAYHINRVNVAIHMVCVPLIWITWLAMVLYFDPSLTGLAYKLPLSMAEPLLNVCHSLKDAVPTWIYPHMNAASSIAAAYLIYYFILDVMSALLITPLWVSYYLIAWYVAQQSETSIMPVFGVFMFSWVAQFYGHGIHEGRAPALLDNLLGAVVLAPLFVFIETLFMVAIGQSYSVGSRMKRLDCLSSSVPHTQLSQRHSNDTHECFSAFVSKTFFFSSYSIFCL